MKCRYSEYFNNRLDIIDTFYIDDNDLNIINTGNWTKTCFNTHSKRVKYQKDAKLIILKILNVYELIQKSSELSNYNDFTKYYLILIRVNLDFNLNLLDLPIFKMKNVLFFTFDLRDHVLKDDKISALRGVTIPSPYKFNSYDKIIFDQEKKYLFSFKGNCNQNGWFDCANVRKKMKALSKESTNCSFNFLYEDTNDFGINTDKQLYENILLNSTYGLVLHGDGRWSHRLIETMGSGSIPVLISDGLTLPFEQLIDYSDAIVKIKESDIYNLTDINDFINFLPTDPEKIKTLQFNSLNIYNTFFKSDETICDMLLLCAKIEIKNT